MLLLRLVFCSHCSCMRCFSRSKYGKIAHHVYYFIYFEVMHVAREEALIRERKLSILFLNFLPQFSPNLSGENQWNREIEFTLWIPAILCLLIEVMTGTARVFVKTWSSRLRCLLFGNAWPVSTTETAI